jgi:plastocyanin
VRLEAAFLVLGAALALPLVGCSSSMAQMDAGQTMPGPCPAFEDHSTATANRTVDFGGQGTSGPFAYSPMCMQIAKGQSVTFSGDFSVHPLEPGVPPGAPSTGSPNNPIHAGSGNSGIAIPFASAGRYPYYCSQHYAAGMVGEIEVR